MGFPGGSVVKNLPANADQDPGFDQWVREISWRRKWHPLLDSWEISWTEEPGRLQSMESQSDTTQQLNNNTMTTAALSVQSDIMRPRTSTKWKIKIKALQLAEILRSLYY